jgi:hypothetical protein
MSLSAGTVIGLPLPGFPDDPAAEGGFLQYWFMIGGSCNADSGESDCEVSLNANCSNLIVDIFEF